jgi:hypothetical protein
MLEMLLSAAPFGDVKHTGDAILRTSKHELVGYGVGKYESYFTPAGKEIVKVDTVLPSVHMKVTDNASNIKKAFSFFDGGFCFLHTLELVVREFMEDDSVKPWLMKIKGLCRHLKMSLTGWSCFVELCDMKHIAIASLPSAVRPGGEGITSRFCGTLNGRNRCANIILKDRTLQFG